MYPHCAALAMNTSDNPYTPPASPTSAGPPAAQSRFPRGFLYVQVAASVLGVLAGVSESNRFLAWAQILIPLVYVIAPLLLVSPLILLGLCAYRGLPLLRIAVANAASVSLSVVGFWGMLPLVQ